MIPATTTTKSPISTLPLPPEYLPLAESLTPWPDAEIPDELRNLEGEMVNPE